MFRFQFFFSNTIFSFGSGAKHSKGCSGSGTGYSCYSLRFEYYTYTASARDGKFSEPERAHFFKTRIHMFECKHFFFFFFANRNGAIFRSEKRVPVRSGPFRSPSLYRRYNFVSAFLCHHSCVRVRVQVYT